MSYVPISTLMGSGGAPADGSITAAKLAPEVVADISGKQPAGDYALTSSLTWSNLGGKPPTFAPAAHGHVIADVTGLQSALDGKQAAGAYLTSITGAQVTTALGYTPTSVAGLTGAQTLAAFKTGLGLTGTNSGDQDLSSFATTAALTAGLATKQASGTYASGTGSASGTNTGDETKASIDTKIGANGGTDFYRKDGTWATPAGGGGGGTLPTLYTLGAAHSNSTVTPTTIGGASPWTHTLAAGKVYRFTIFADYQSAALTTGGRMNLLGAGGLAGGVKGMMWGGIVQAAAASTLEVPIYSFANGAGSFLLTPSVSPINAPHVWGADFVFVCTTGGTLSLQWASEVAASAAQLNAQSVMMVEQLN